MNAEIIRMSGDLKREVWGFVLWIDYKPHMALDRYWFQTKDTPRKRIWQTQTYFNRTDSRNNTVINPPIPDNVATEVKEFYANAIRETEIAK